MNFHLLVVHFPIALLSLYCLFECITLFKKFQTPTLLNLKVRLLRSGTISIFFALMTGEGAEDIVGKSPIVSLHESLADMTRNVFVLLSCFYLIFLFDISAKISNISPKVGQSFVYVRTIVKKMHHWQIMFILACIGFLLLSAVAAVGGSISHGITHDPIAQFILYLAGL